MTITFTPSFISIIFSIITVLVLLAWGWVGVQTWLKRRRLGAVDQQNIARRWKEIETMFGSESEPARKLAILEADKLLDEILKTLMMPGETMGERMKVAGYKYEGIREAWTGHKIRNRLVHESVFHLSPRLAREAMTSFKSAFKSLGLL